LTLRDVTTFRPTERFSERVENYIRFRPSYPRGVVELLRREAGLAPSSVVADVGSGTGLLARLFLENGNQVYGVEPNREMREAGERLLKDFPRFVSVGGSAEATTLQDASVDFVAAAQAFHWFDRARARREFRRILRPGGSCVLVWNDRRRDSTPFSRDLESFLVEYGVDYSPVAEGYVAADEESAGVLRGFFGGAYRAARFDNFQALDFEGLRGRVLSASYMPLPGHERFDAMLAALDRLFDARQEGGKVIIEYDTNVYYGQIS
jgi:SAM-dependent methyltransferase